MYLIFSIHIKKILKALFKKNNQKILYVVKDINKIKNKKKHQNLSNINLTFFQLFSYSINSYSVNITDSLEIKLYNLLTRFRLYKYLYNRTLIL